MTSILPPEDHSSSSQVSLFPDIASNSSFDGREISQTPLAKSRPASLLSRHSTDSIELPDEIIRAEGLRHSDEVLNAKKYKTPLFMDKLFAILQELQVPTWSERLIPSNASISSVHSASSLAAYGVSPPSKDQVWIHKVSGSLTNAVYFVLVPPPDKDRSTITSFQSQAPYRTLLLRIYGASSSSLINRAAELRILHVLSSRYRIGPRVWGTFTNGRVEEYFESDPLTAEEMRDSQISRWIAVRMSELHRVDVRKVVDPVEWADPADGTRGELGVKRNVRSWIPPAKEVLKLIRDEAYKKEIDIESFAKQWDTYYKWVRDWEKENDCRKESPRVFCHNDTQYGNLLRLKSLQPGKLPHQQIIVVDFEYACPNPAAFDIGNQFCEWTTDYLGENPARLKPSRYPTKAQRDNFYLAYLQSGLLLDGSNVVITDPSTPHSSITESPASTPTTSSPALSRQGSTPQLSKTPPLSQFTNIRSGSSTFPESMDLLEEQVRRWMPASHAMWAVWAIVQAKENVERDNAKMDGNKGDEEDVMEFDYLQYANDRIRIFRGLCKEMGVF